MRLPRITKHESNVEDIHIHIDDVPEFKYYHDMSDDKMIKYIERIVRNSYEYREYVQFLKDEMDLNHCVFLFNVDMDMVSIEMHHSLFTLYDIVAVVLNKYRESGKKFSAFDVANEVVLLHYKNQIALAPVTKTVHDLIHAGEIFMPIQLMYGNWKQFYLDYKKYMTSELIERAKDYISLSNEIIEDYQVPIIQRRYTYLTVDGFTLPRRIPVEDEEAM